MDVPIMRLCESCRRKLGEKYVVNELPGETLGACFACADKKTQPVRCCEVSARVIRYPRHGRGGGERERARAWRR